MSVEAVTTLVYLCHDMVLSMLGAHVLDPLTATRRNPLGRRTWFCADCARLSSVPDSQGFEHAIVVVERLRAVWSFMKSTLVV